MNKIRFASITLLLFLFMAGGCSSFEKPSGDEIETTPIEEPESTVIPEEEETAPTPPAEEAAEEDIKGKAAPEETPATPPKTEVPKTVVKNFNIIAKQFEFSPNTITVNEGDTVRISVSSTDTTHGLMIPDFGVNKTIPAGSTVTVEFIASKKGTFQFRCSVFCGQGHPEMNGTLVVQ